MVPTLAATLGVKGHRPTVGTRDCKDLLYALAVVNLVTAAVHANTLESPKTAKKATGLSKTRRMQEAFASHLRHVGRVYPARKYKRVVLVIDTRQLIRAAAGADPVWVAGITEKADALRRELLGPNPSALDDLLARRVVNGWVAVHALELELAVRPPSDRRSRDYIDRALTRAQKRMTDAARELTRVRRLVLPPVLTRVAAPAPVALPAG